MFALPPSIPFGTAFSAAKSRRLLFPEPRSGTGELLRDARPSQQPPLPPQIYSSVQPRPLPWLTRGLVSLFPASSSFEREVRKTLLSCLFDTPDERRCWDGGALCRIVNRKTTSSLLCFVGERRFLGCLLYTRTASFLRRGIIGRHRNDERITMFMNPGSVAGPLASSLSTCCELCFPNLLYALRQNEK